MSLPEHRRILTHFDISEQGLRELEIWLRARLGIGTGGGTGDYVYLGVVIANEDGQFSLDAAALARTKGGHFSHLVLELLLYQDGGVLGGDLEALWISWGADTTGITGNGYWSGVTRFYSDDNPTAAEGMFSHVAPSGDFPDQAVIVPDFIPPTQASATSLTLKFPRFHNYLGEYPTVQFQGVTINATPDNGISRAIVSGAGGNIAYNDPIGGIRIACSSNFTSDSRIEVYGIRGETL